MAVKSSDLAEDEIVNALCGAEMRKRSRHRCRMHSYIYIYTHEEYNRTTGPARVDLDYGVWNAKAQYGWVAYARAGSPSHIPHGRSEVRTELMACSDP